MFQVLSVLERLRIKYNTLAAKYAQYVVNAKFAGMYRER